MTNQSQDFTDHAVTSYTSYEFGAQGTKCHGANTSAEAIEAAGLDWDVHLAPLSAHVPDGPDAMKRIEVPNQFASVRSDNDGVLGVVGKKYHILQNRDAFGFIDGLLQDGVMKYEQAGCWNGGKKVWALASMRGLDFTINGNDVQKPYLLLTTSHDGSGSVKVFPTIHRIFCSNQLPALERERKKNADMSFSFTHTRNMVERMAQASRVMRVMNRNIAYTASAARRLSDKKITPGAARDFFTKFLPFEFETNKDFHEGRSGAAIHRVEDNLREEFDLCGQNWWAAYNALTGWIDHQQSRNGKTKADKANQQMQAVTIGAAAKVKRNAFAAADFACA